MPGNVGKPRAGDGASGGGGMGNLRRSGWRGRGRARAVFFAEGFLEGGGGVFWGYEPSRSGRVA